MLHFILGRSGSGKTTRIRSQLKELAEAGKDNLVLIVPEQASFENERAMLHLLGAKNARRVFVTSFSRLADTVLHRFGGFAGKRLDDGGRSIFMSLALEQVRDRLQMFRKNAESTELVGLMLQISAEFKMCGVSSEDLLKAADGLAGGTLSLKMRETALILSAYDALVSQSYIDPLDDLTKLKNTLEEHPFFEGAAVAVDSFQSFTVQQYAILKLILRQAEDVTFALCTDSLDDPEHGCGLFSLVRRTAHRLERLARDNGLKVAAPVILKEAKRFQSPDLAALEENAYRPSPAVYAGPCPNVRVYEAQNAYDEAAFVCASIRQLVMSADYRYGDITIIARSTETYRGVLDEALEKWEIPYFMDRPEELDSEPLMRLILSAFRVACGGFRSDDLFLYLKTGLAGLSPQQISELENYVFVWNLDGAKWKEEWTAHPEGFAGEMGRADAELLARVNDSRRRSVGPLQKFAEATADATGEEMALAAYRLLEEIKAAENLRAFTKRLSQESNPALAERELRTWDILMEILNQAAIVIGKSKLSRSRFAELLRLVIRSERISSIPQGLDEVTVGGADRIRPGQPKAVFLIGAVQGEFPLAPGGTCVFTDNERKELIRLGLPLNDTAEGVAVQERFLAYTAMSAASRRLTVSYPVSDGAGKAKAPSSLVGQTLTILKCLQIQREELLDPAFFAGAAKPALELAARTWNANDPFSASLKELLRRRGASGRLADLERAAKREPAAFADPARAMALFGRDMRVSATQIERFYLCRFQYFCRYGLNVRERREAQLDALEYGSTMHFLLQKMFQEVGSAAILTMNNAELMKKIRGYLAQYAEQKFGGLTDKTPRFVWLISRLADSARVVILHIARELSQSGFIPADFELDIGASVGPLVIPLPEGGEVRIDGKIDRVDLMERGGARWVRVVDYKTGAKEFRLSDLIYGMNMQMLIYLAALCENGGARYGKLSPAGVLYMPANRPSVPEGRTVLPENLEKDTFKKLRMDGLVVDDRQVITGMEREANGAYIPVSLKDGKTAGGDHAVSPQEMERVLRYIRELTAAMARELQAGSVAAVPLTGSYDACAWCPYGPVCGHERDDPAREMGKQDRETVLRQMSEEGGKTT